MNFNLFEIAYFLIYDFASYIGCTFISIALLVVFVRKQHLSKRLKIILGVLAVSGLYLILWNFRIINLPYRNADKTKQDKVQAIQENKDATRYVDYNTFKPSYTPSYIKSWSPIYSVLPPTDADPARVTIEYDRYLTGEYLDSEVTSLFENKPSVDIHQESTRNSSCSTAYILKKYDLIGHNDSGGDILKASDDIETAYLTDYMGTRLVLQSCSLSGGNELTDQYALKMFHNLKPFDIKTANFSDPRK